MIYTEHKITLDMHKPVVPVTVCVKKGDTARRLLVYFAAKGQPYHISPDCYGVFTAKKPDGKVVFNNCSIEECVISYDFTAQTVAVVGTVDSEIILYGADGKQITSASFQIVVEDTIYDTETEIESTDEFNALSDLVGKVQALRSIESIEQTTTSSEDGGTNVFTVTLDDGTKSEFQVKNGSKGSTGPVGPQGLQGNDGDDGQRGGLFLKITTSPSAYTAAVDGFKPAYRILLATVLAQSGAEDVIAGDVLCRSSYQYVVGRVKDGYVYTSAYTSNKGSNGTNGTDGQTPYIGENGNWWIGETDTGVQAQGEAFTYEDFTEAQLTALKGEIVAAVLANFTDVSKEGQ